MIMLRLDKLITLVEKLPRASAKSKNDSRIDRSKVINENHKTSQERLKSPIKSEQLVERETD